MSPERQPPLLPEGRRVTAADALAKLPTPDGKRFTPVHRDRAVEIEFYAPRGTDPQGPHDRDEAYVVVSGTGWFVNGARRERFGPGDLLLVPAGVEHRFEEFTGDLAVWVFFWG